MINAGEIESKSAEFKIAPRSVEKDYVFGWVLAGVCNNPFLNDLLILKGGNALRKAYLPNARFSKDLDFSTQQEIDPIRLETELRNVINFAQENSGVKFLLDKTKVTSKFIFEESQIYEGRTVFKGFYQEEEANIKIHLDITEFDNIILPVQNKRLIHLYSDSEICQSTLRVYKLEELLASKILTILRRCKATDIFDLSYGILKAPNISINRLELISTFLKKTIHESQPDIVKQQLLGRSFEDARPYWRNLVAPVSALFDFDEAIRSLIDVINLLFALLPAVNARPLGFGMSVRTYGGGTSYFSNDLRDIIIQAGESLKMINILYNGAWRIVEPYALRYHVRKKDNRGFEYFWAWDTSGGNSNKIGIKQFISDRIQNLQITNQAYFPRFPIEL